MEENIAVIPSGMIRGRVIQDSLYLLAAGRPASSAGRSLIREIKRI
jgi:hypothetical protein